MAEVIERAKPFTIDNEISALNGLLKDVAAHHDETGKFAYYTCNGWAGDVLRCLLGRLIEERDEGKKEDASKS